MADFWPRPQTGSAPSSPLLPLPVGEGYGEGCLPTDPLFRRATRAASIRAGLLGLCFAVATVPCRAAAPRSVTALAFAPDGKSLVAGSARSVRVYAIPDGKLASSITLDFAKITSLRFGAAGKLLVVAGGNPGIDGGVAILEWPSAKASTKFGDHTDLVTAAEFDSATRRLLIASSDRRAEVLSWPGAQRLYSLDGHAGPILGAAFSPDDKLIVTVSADRSVKVWDATDGSLQHSFSQHTDIVHGVAFRPRVLFDGQAVPFYCATGSEDRTVRVWQPAIGRMVRIVRGNDGPIFAVAYSPDGGKLYAAGQEGIIRVIDSDSDEIRQQWKAHEDWIYALAVSPVGDLLASADWTGFVRLWRMEAAKWTMIQELSRPVVP